MNRPVLEKDKKIEHNVIKYLRNLFNLKKEINDNIIKDIRNLFNLKKENEAIKDRIVRDIRCLFGQEEEYHYKLVRVGNFRSNNYTKYESNGNRSKALPIEEYINKIRPYLKDIKNDLKKSDTWKF